MFEDTIRFYEGLQGLTCERRAHIPERGVDAAKVGGFLIFAADPDRLGAISSADAIFYLDSLDDFHAWLVSQGA